MNDQSSTMYEYFIGNHRTKHTATEIQIVHQTK